MTTATGRRRCLVVDDEADGRDFLQRALAEEFEVSQAASGEEALALLKRERFAVVITDHRLPGLNGVELLEHAARLDPQMIRLMLTAYDDSPDVIDARRRGVALAVLLKPTTAVFLADSVRRWLAFAVRADGPVARWDAVHDRQGAQSDLADGGSGAATLPAAPGGRRA